MPRTTANKTDDYSSFFGKLVLAKFDSMPEWVRVCAFFISLLVLVYIALHSLNSRYFVTGTVLEPSPAHAGSNQVARGFDVRWADNYAGTNSKGHYVFVLTPMQYLGLMKSGNHSLEIWKSGDQTDIEDQQICSKTVPFERTTNEFDDYYIDGHCGGENAAAKLAIPSVPQSPVQSHDFELTEPVMAAVAANPSRSYRILARTVRFAVSWPRSDSGEMILFQNGSEFSLSNPSGDGYGGISVLPGGSFAFTDGVFLPANSLAGGRIRLSDKSNVFTYTEEWFDLPEPLQLGKPIAIQGSRGSQLTLVAINPSTITIFRKSGDEKYYGKLSQDLLAAGVLPASSTAPLGPDAETNTLFVGADVQPSTVKSVVAAIVKNGVSLKRIAYPYSFTSTSDTTRLQLGSSKACFKSAAIKPEALAPLAAATDDQVKLFLAKYAVCD